MIDNIPAWLAIPLAVILWVFLVQMMRVEAQRTARESARAAAFLLARASRDHFPDYSLMDWDKK